MSEMRIGPSAERASGRAWNVAHIASSGRDEDLTFAALAIDALIAKARREALLEAIALGGDDDCSTWQRPAFKLNREDEPWEVVEKYQAAIRALAAKEQA